MSLTSHHFTCFFHTKNFFILLAKCWILSMNVWIVSSYKMRGRLASEPLGLRKEFACDIKSQPTLLLYCFIGGLDVFTWSMCHFLIFPYMGSVFNFGRDWWFLVKTFLLCHCHFPLLYREWPKYPFVTHLFLFKSIFLFCFFHLTFAYRILVNIYFRYYIFRIIRLIRKVKKYKRR